MNDLLLLSKYVDFLQNSFSEKEKEERNIPALLKFLHRKKGVIEKICLVSSPYGLMLYLLHVGDIERTLFVFYGAYPLKDAAAVLRKFGAVCIFTSFDEHVKQEGEVLTDIVKYIATAGIYDVDVYGQDTLPLVTNFFGERFVLLEDGLISYISEEDSKKTRGFKIYGYEEKVKKILFAGLLLIPQILKDKSELINIDVLWSKKTNAERDKILKVFGFDYHSMMQIIDSGRDIIVFTRNYSKVGKCTEEAQIEMYREIIANYDIGRVIIKPHPNDDVDYETYFPQCVILPTKLPAEIIWLCKIPIKIVAGVDTNSNVFGTFKDTIRVDLYTDLIKKYNVIKLRQIVSD